jgi:DmsE family decaheme c-type cytochrome
MGRFTRTLGPLVSITGALGLWLAVVVTLTASAMPRHNGSPSNPTDPKAAAAAKAAAGYVGEETCLGCHEDRAKGYHGSPHSRAADPRTPAAKEGCESCHGPGKAHVEGGGDKTKIKNPKNMQAREVSALCTTCHNRGEHANWKGSTHDSRNITCTTCHSVHEYKSETGQLKAATQLDTCAQCHRDKVNKLNRQGHMPVREGKMVCMTCHNVHGSQNVKLLRTGTSVNEACTSCHTEKRGPFLWEHAPVRENCATCHDPHGSNNDRMLVAKLPMLCQRCHISTRHPPTVYDNTQAKAGSNRLINRSCVNCHQQIHGSNSPSGARFAR